MAFQKWAVEWPQAEIGGNILERGNSMGQKIAVRRNRTQLGYSGQLGQSERKKIETSIPPMSASLLLPLWIQLRCHLLKKSSLTTHSHAPITHCHTYFIKCLAFVSCVVPHLWFHCLLSVAHLEWKCSEESIFAHFCLKSSAHKEAGTTLALSAHLWNEQVVRPARDCEARCGRGQNLGINWELCC